MVDTKTKIKTEEIVTMNIETVVTTMDLVPVKGEYKTKNPTIFYHIFKRIFDIIVGFVGCVLIIPITIAIIIMRNKNKEDGPIFFDQLRIGKKGKHFKLYKYRSMYLNADETLKKYLEDHEEAREEYKKFKKLKVDPRITKTGKILRRTSLDEFPQFFNVLLGDMSIVGPRPYLPRELEDIKFYDDIIKCKPGITGYWQVHGRSDTTFENRNELDKYYVEHRSTWLDLKIFIKTITDVFKKKGAL